jgi:NAD+ kinase
MDSLAPTESTRHLRHVAISEDTIPEKSDQCIPPLQPDAAPAAVLNPLSKSAQDIDVHSTQCVPLGGEAYWNLDALKTLNTTDIAPDLYDRKDSFSSASTQVDDSSPLDLTKSLPASPIFNQGAFPKSFRQHRENALSPNTVPVHTQLKALATNKARAPDLSITSTMNSSQDQTSQECLDAALAGLHMNSSAGLARGITGAAQETPSTARFSGLKSPCFFHQRFDNAVNYDRVLEEITGDEYMSHSRLMQTATSVREVSRQLQRRPVKMAVKNVMIVTKARDNMLVTLTREITEWLLTTPRYGSELGVNVYVDAKLRNSQRFGAKSLIEKNEKFGAMLDYWTPDLCWTSPEKFDLVITLGGDGTVLYTSWLFQRVVPPVLSFSLGSLGFLTNFEYQKFREQLDRVMGDAGMRCNLRMRFTCTVYRAEHGDQQEGEQFEVLNELVIDRVSYPLQSHMRSLLTFSRAHPPTSPTSNSTVTTNF